MATENNNLDMLTANCTELHVELHVDENRLESLPNLHPADVQFILNSLNSSQTEVLAEQFAGENWGILDEIDLELLSEDAEEEEEEESDSSDVEMCDATVIQNRCTVCFVDLGPENPRQLCGKIRCLQFDFDDLTAAEEDIDFTIDSTALVPWADMYTGEDSFELYIQPHISINF